MSIHLNWRNKQRISLDINDHDIRMINVRPSGYDSVRMFAEKELPKGVIQGGNIVDFDVLQQILADCVSEWGIQRENVRFHVPDPFVFLRKIVIPDEVQSDEIKGYLYMEIGTSIHLPFEDPVFDYQLIEEQGKKEILLFASPEHIVEQYTEVLESVKLKPAAADVSSLSIYRLLHSMDRVDPDEHAMFIQYEGQTANVSIFHNDRPVFIRQLLTGDETKEVDHISQTQNIESPFADKMNDTFIEIERIMNFYRYSMSEGNAQINRITLLGDHPKLAKIGEELKKMLMTPLDVLNDLYLETIKGQKIPAKYMRALGLAIKEVR